MKARHESRLELHVLHAARQALIMKAAALAGSLPCISKRRDTSQRGVICMVCNLRLGEAAWVLAGFFRSPARRTRSSRR